LGISQFGFVRGDFHRLKSAAANESSKNQTVKSTVFLVLFRFHNRRKRPPLFIIQALKVLFEIFSAQIWYQKNHGILASHLLIYVW
jgi:hypothetical protein